MRQLFESSSRLQRDMFMDSRVNRAAILFYCVVRPFEEQAASRCEERSCFFCDKLLACLNASRFPSFTSSAWSKYIIQCNTIDCLSFISLHFGFS